MTTERRRLLVAFREHRRRTTSLLAALSQAEIRRAPVRGLGSFGRHFRHIANVTEAYARAIHTGRIDFTFRPWAPELALASADLRSILKSSSRSLFAAVRRPAHSQIRWGRERVALNTHLLRLIEHEVLHHGELIVYWSALRRRFPVNWRTWGLR